MSIGHLEIGKLSAYMEFCSSVSSEQGPSWIGTVDTWLTYQINKNLLSTGCLHWCDQYGGRLASVGWYDLALLTAVRAIKIWVLRDVFQQQLVCLSLVTALRQQ